MKKHIPGLKTEQFIDKLKSVYPETFRQIVDILSSADLLKSFRVKKNLSNSILDSLKQENFIINDTEFEDIYTGKESGDHSLSRSSSFINHDIYIQDLSSMLPVLELKAILDIDKEYKILDMCASPGSKTTQLSEAFINAEISALEKDRNRFFTLKKVLEDYKSTNVNAFLTDAIRIPLAHPELQETFDVVLLDAPCSSEGTIRQLSDENLKFWNRHKYKDFVNIQKRLLTSAVHLVKPGGIIMYSTCTYGPEENELVIDKIIKKYEDLEIEPFKNQKILDLENVINGFKAWKEKNLEESLVNTVRVLPTKRNGGFYMAKIKKKKV